MGLLTSSTSQMDKEGYGMLNYMPVTRHVNQHLIQEKKLIGRFIYFLRICDALTRRARFSHMFHPMVNYLRHCGITLNHLFQVRQFLVIISEIMCNPNKYLVSKL
jgi:hypothetical protein